MQQRKAVNNDGLRESANPSGKSLAEDECGAWSWAGKEFLHNAEVTLPDDVDAIKNGDKENALRQDPGSDEVQIRNVAGVHRPAAREHFPEDQQPKRGLEGAGDEFGEIVPQLTQLKLGDDKCLVNETGKRVDECGGHRIGSSQGVGP